MDTLPDEFTAAEVFSRLDVATWARCKAVCRAWRKTLSVQSHPANGLPCLWAYHLYHTDYEIVDFLENTICAAQLPPQMHVNSSNLTLRRYRCAGSFGPWVILIINFQQGNEMKAHVFLYNPLSSEHMSLPNLDWLASESYRVRARMSCLPNETNLLASKCVVAAFIFEDIYLCKPNDKAWNKVMIFGPLLSRDFRICDAVFHCGSDDRLLLYFIDERNKMVALDVEDNFVVTISQNILKENYMLFGNKGAFFKLVVDCLGELLVVGVSYSYKKKNLVSRFIVLKLQQRKLVGLYNLDGGMIFISKDQCYCSRAASESGFFVKDSVYYLHFFSLGSVQGSEYKLLRYPANQPWSFTLPKVLHKILTKESVFWFMPMIT